MSPRYNDNRKTPRPEENQEGILKICAFCQKIQQRYSGPGESAIGIVYLTIRIHLKSCCIFPQKVATTTCSGSRKGRVGA